VNSATITVREAMESDFPSGIREDVVVERRGETGFFPGHPQ